MPNSHLTQLWEGNEVFENLKYMDLSHSQYLTETPDFSRVTNLKVLILDGCTQLCKIHRSLGDLDKLARLSLKNCINLEHFPNTSQLVSLVELDLSGCSKLRKFPDIVQHMPCVRSLSLNGTAIRELPSSIGYATELEILDLENCRKLRSLPSSIGKLTLLESLHLSGCSRLGKPQVNSGNLDALPRTLDRLCGLEKLERQNCRSLPALPALPSILTLSLSGCSDLGKCEVNSGALPGSLDQLCSLQRLDLQNYSSLRVLPVPPSSLEFINASNCESLEDINPQSVFSLGRGSIFANCFKLTKFQSRMERDLQSMAAHVDQEKWRSTLRKIILVSVVQQNPAVAVLFSTVFPGSGILDWFEHRSEGHEINIQVSQNWYASDFLGFALSAVVAPEKESLTSGWITYCDLGCGALNSKLKSNGIFSFSFVDGWTQYLEHITIGSDHVWLAYVPSFLGFAPEKLSLKFSFGTSEKSCIVKHCGVYPVYIRSSRDEDCSYIDDGNPSGRDLDDLHEWRLEDNTIGRSQKKRKDTTIRSFDDAEPRGIGFSCTNAHACDQQMLQMGPDPSIFQFSNAHYIPGGSVLDTLCEWYAMIRRSLHEILEDLQQSESQEIGCLLTDLRCWHQERFERQPNPSISNIEIHSWVFITIFSFLLLVRIFYWAPFQIPPLLNAPFWISLLVAAPFGTSTLVAAPFGISSVLSIPFEISTLLGGPFGISTLMGGVVLLLFILSRQ
ncbi:hypothetical protein PVL29_013598 [Vitis rotundifolia]|uniref:Uncharacterized protein n=1 Tax=Vitis rotundifolia TaxID=103349 RepID=A0AA38ZNB5_VITRO|nr:hypothetical protein PVL29_013598 [Vitis rotundifolia]